MARVSQAIASSAVIFANVLAHVPAAAEEHITLPTLTPAAEAGADLFAAHCERCHGVAAGGSDSGPPLVHPIYEPNHHGDAAFYLAALRGARSHHWNFGDMPPVEGVTQDDIGKIVVFVREIQRANGIE